MHLTKIFFLENQVLIYFQIYFKQITYLSFQIKVENSYYLYYVLSNPKGFYIVNITNWQAH